MLPRVVGVESVRRSVCGWKGFGAIWMTVPGLLCAR